MKYIQLTESILLISILLLNEVECQLSAGQVIEQALVKKLFTNYSRTIRPNDQVSVTVGLQLKQIISLAEKTQILTTSIYVEQWWNDERLSWIPNSYNNITALQLSLKNIWLPDTNVVNSASSDGYFTMNSDFGFASVLYTGDIYYVSPAIAMPTRCSLEVQYFPFDSHTCSLIMTSWAYGDKRIFYSVNDSYVDVSDFTTNGVWTLTNSDVTSIIKSDKSSGFEDNSDTYIYLNLYIQRNPLYYIMNSIFPCFILNCVTLIGYFMPFPMGMILASGGMMTFAVYNVAVSNFIPIQSDFLPDVSWYFITSITYNLVSIVWYVYMNQCKTKNEIPKCLV